MLDLPPITRPNGNVYRPRKLAAYRVSDNGDDFTSVVVLGTDDPVRAQPLADELVRFEVDSQCAAANLRHVWWRDGFENGQRAWVTDEAHGRAGVWFQEIEETSA